MTLPLIGNWLLSVLSITIPAFRIAGGLLLFSVAYEMLLGVQTSMPASRSARATTFTAPVMTIARPLAAQDAIDIGGGATRDVYLAAP
jgi:multiple antibiotic resistance protein